MSCAAQSEATRDAEGGAAGVVLGVMSLIPSISELACSCARVEGCGATAASLAESGCARQARLNEMLNTEKNTPQSGMNRRPTHSVYKGPFRKL